MLKNCLYYIVKHLIEYANVAGGGVTFLEYRIGLKNYLFHIEIKLLDKGVLSDAPKWH